MARRHGVLTFRTTQMLTGHGCFGGYLYRFAGRKPDARCHHCYHCLDETAQHTLEVCSVWASQRRDDDLSLPAVVKAMAGSETSWVAGGRHTIAAFRPNEPEGGQLGEAGRLLTWLE